MKKQIVALVLGVAVIGGVGVGIAANALTEAPDERPTTSPTTSSSPSTTSSASPSTPSRATAGLVPLADLVVKPGSVGPVTAGMSKADALATGYLVPGTSDQGCPAPPLTWRTAYATSLDVQSLGNGEVASIGIRGTGPRTEDGLGVGSTYADVKTVVDMAAEEAGYGQSGTYLYDGENGGYVGFLFDEAPARLTDSSKVTFVEVTKRAQPSLMRDGC